jgi:hypothetical protein
MLTPDDLSELRHLVDRYADAVDRRDRDALAAVFTPEGSLRMQAGDGPPGDGWTGPDLVRAVDSVEPYHRTFHHLGGAVFEAGPGSGEATGRVLCQAHHYDRTANGPVDLVMLIRYHDHYARTAGGWRFADRIVAVQWTELHPAHPIRRRQ